MSTPKKSGGSLYAKKTKATDTSATNTDPTTNPYVLLNPPKSNTPASTENKSNHNDCQVNQSNQLSFNQTYDTAALAQSFDPFTETVTLNPSMTGKLSSKRSYSVVAQSLRSYPTLESESINIDTFDSLFGSDDDDSFTLSHTNQSQMRSHASQITTAEDALKYLEEDIQFDGNAHNPSLLYAAPIPQKPLASIPQELPKKTQYNYYDDCPPPPDDLDEEPPDYHDLPRDFDQYNGHDDMPDEYDDTPARGTGDSTAPAPQEQPKPNNEPKLMLSSRMLRVPPETQAFIAQQQAIRRHMELEKEKRRSKREKHDHKSGKKDRFAKPLDYDDLYQPRTVEEREARLRAKQQEINNIEEIAISHDVFKLVTQTPRKSAQEAIKLRKKQEDLMRSVMKDKVSTNIVTPNPNEPTLSAKQQKIQALEKTFSFQARSAILPTFDRGSQVRSLLKTYYPTMGENTEFIPPSMQFRRAEEIGGCINDDVNVLNSLKSEEPYKEYLQTGRVFNTMRGWSEYMSVGQPEEMLSELKEKIEACMVDGDHDEEASMMKDINKNVIRKPAPKYSRISKPVYLVLESYDQKALRLQVRRNILEVAQHNLLNMDSVDQIYNTLDAYEEEEYRNSINTTNAIQVPLIKQLAKMTSQLKNLSIANRKSIVSTILQKHEERQNATSISDEYLEYISLLKDQHTHAMESAIKLNLHDDSIKNLQIRQQLELELAMAIVDARQVKRDQKIQRLREQRHSMFKDGVTNHNEDIDDDEIDQDAILQEIVSKNEKYKEFVKDNTTLQYFKEEFTLAENFGADGTISSAESDDGDDDMDESNKGRLERERRLQKKKQLIAKRLKQRQEYHEKTKNMLFVDKYAPKSYSQLLSAEKYNRQVLMWMSGYNSIVFGKPVPRPPQYKHSWQIKLDAEREKKQEERSNNFDMNKKDGENNNKNNDNRFQRLTPQQEHDVITKLGPQNKKILLLSGPAGSGKTTLISIICNLLNYRRIEINASDDRSYDAVSQKIINALESNSVFDQTCPNCLVLEEIDGAVTPDAGSVLDTDSGASTVVGILQKIAQDAVAYDKHMVKKIFFNSHDDDDNIDGDGESDDEKTSKKSKDPKEKKDAPIPGKQLTRPIIATCNVLQAPCLKQLLPYCKIIELPAIDSDALLHRLEYVVSQESIFCDGSFLKGLVELMGTDIRSCLHALQFSSFNATKRYQTLNNHGLVRLNKPNVLRVHDLQKMRLGQHDSPTSVTDLVQLSLTLQESNTNASAGIMTHNTEAHVSQASQRLASIGNLRAKYNIMSIPKKAKLFMANQHKPGFIDVNDPHALDLADEMRVYNLINYNIDILSNLIIEYGSLPRVMEQLFYLHPVYTGYFPDIGHVSHCSELVSMYDAATNTRTSQQANTNILSESLACLPMLISYYVANKITNTFGGGSHGNGRSQQKKWGSKEPEHFDPRQTIRLQYNNLQNVMNQFNSKVWELHTNQEAIRTFTQQHYLIHCKTFLSIKEGVMTVLPFLFDMLIVIPAISNLPTLVYNIPPEEFNAMIDNDKNENENENCKPKSKLLLDDDDDDDNEMLMFMASPGRKGTPMKQQSTSKPPQLQQLKAIVVSSQQSISSGSWSNLCVNPIESALMKNRIIPLMSKLHMSYEPSFTRFNKNQFIFFDKYSKQYEITPNVVNAVYFDMSLTLKLFQADEILAASDKMNISQQTHFKLLTSHFPSRRQVVITDVYEAAKQTAAQYNQFYEQKPGQMWNRFGSNQLFFGFPNTLKQSIAQEVKLNIATRAEKDRQTLLQQQRDAELKKQLEQQRLQREIEAHSNEQEMWAIYDDMNSSSANPTALCAVKTNTPKANNNEGQLSDEEKKKLEEQEGQAYIDRITKQYANISVGVQIIQADMDAQQAKIDAAKNRSLFDIDGNDSPDAPAKSVKVINFRQFIDKSKPTVPPKTQTRSSKQGDSDDVVPIDSIPNEVSISAAAVENEDKGRFIRSNVAKSRSAHTLQLMFFDGFSNAVKRPVDMSFFFD